MAWERVKERERIHRKKDVRKKGGELKPSMNKLWCAYINEDSKYNRRLQLNIPSQQLAKQHRWTV